MNAGNQKSVCIVGAGITGLSAGWKLLKNGYNVTVFEAESRPGGVIRTERSGDWLAECGPNTLLETTPLLKQFFTEVGVEDRKYYSEPSAKNRYIVRYGKPINLPSSPPAFFASRLFSPSAKFRLLIEPFIGRGHGEESVADFVLRRLGQEFLDYAIDPLVSGIYAGDPRKISLKHAFAKVYNLESRYGSLILGQILGAKERKKRGEISKADAPKVSFDDGLQVLTDSLAHSLRGRVFYNATVTRIVQKNGGFEVSSNLDGMCKTAIFNAVVIAIPAYKITEIQIFNSSGEQQNLSILGKIEYPPVASVVLGYRREDVEHPLDGFGVLVPRKEKFRILGTIFNSSLFPRRAPAGHVTLTTYLGGAQNPDIALLPEEKLIQITHEDLQKLLGVKGKVTFSYTAVYPRAIPQYNVGYGEFLDFMNRIECKLAGLFLVGHFRNGVSLSDSILAGLRVSDRISEFIKTKSTSTNE